MMSRQACSIPHQERDRRLERVDALRAGAGATHADFAGYRPFPFGSYPIPRGPQGRSSRDDVQARPAARRSRRCSPVCRSRDIGIELFGRELWLGERMLHVPAGRIIEVDHESRTAVVTPVEGGTASVRLFPPGESAPVGPPRDEVHAGEGRGKGGQAKFV